MIHCIFIRISLARVVKFNQENSCSLSLIPIRGVESRGLDLLVRRYESLIVAFSRGFLAGLNIDGW